MSMKTFVTPIAVIALAGLVLPPAVPAQNAPPPGMEHDLSVPFLVPPLPVGIEHDLSRPVLVPPPLQPGEQTRPVAIQVRNVRPSYLAWKLDAAHHPLPTVFQVFQQGSLKMSITPPSLPLEPLPKGVEQIIAVDPQNILLVQGTAAGVEHIKARVKALDMPLRQVEVEVQLVQIDPQDAESLVANPEPVNPAPGEGTQGSLTLHPIRGASAPSTLRRLLKDHKAKVLSAPRVIALDGLNAALNMMGTAKEVVNFNYAPALEATRGFQFAATPTVDMTRNDTGTVGVSFSLGQTLQFSQKSGVGVFPLQTLNILPATFTANDGELWIITAPVGYFASFVDELEKTNPANVMVLVKASIVRRAGEK